jgi:hypothetical protein
MLWVLPIRLSWMDLHGKLFRWNFEGPPKETINGQYNSNLKLHEEGRFDET